MWLWASYFTSLCLVFPFPQLYSSIYLRRLLGRLNHFTHKVPRYLLDTQEKLEKQINSSPTCFLAFTPSQCIQDLDYMYFSCLLQQKRLFQNLMAQNNKNVFFFMTLGIDRVVSDGLTWAHSWKVSWGLDPVEAALLLASPGGLSSGLLHDIVAPDMKRQELQGLLRSRLCSLHNIPSTLFHGSK